MTDPFPAPCHPDFPAPRWPGWCCAWGGPKTFQGDHPMWWFDMNSLVLKLWRHSVPWRLTLGEFRLLLAKVIVYFCFQRCQGACQVQAARFRRSWNVLGKMFEALWAVRAGSQMESATKESSHVWPAFIPLKLSPQIAFERSKKKIYVQSLQQLSVLRFLDRKLLGEKAVWVEKESWYPNDQILFA